MISRRGNRIVDSYRPEETTMTIHTKHRTPDSPAAPPTTYRSVPASGATVVTLDREAARAAIGAAAARFTALLREIDDIERQAAGTDWTVAETAAMWPSC
jgi:hypothetical protein